MDLQVLDIEFNDRDLTIKGFYDEGEEEVRYYSDMSGCPATPAYFHAHEIKLQGRNIINLLSDETIEEIEEICFNEIH